MEQQEQQDKTIRKLKKQLKVYMKKVEDFEGNPTALPVFIQYIFKITLAQHQSRDLFYCASCV